MSALGSSSLNFPDFTVTGLLLSLRSHWLRERYQDVKVKEFGDKWRIDYWDYTTTPRRKRGKKWSKKYVPTKREAQKRADEFMEQVNERNNSPQLCSTDGDTFASLVKLCREKVLPHLKNSTRMHYEFFLETYLIPEFGATRITKIRRITHQSAVFRISVWKNRNGSPIDVGDFLGDLALPLIATSVLVSR